MKKIFLTIVVLVVLLIAGWEFFRNKEDVLVNTSTPTLSSVPTPLVSLAVSKNIIIYTDSGYTPNTLTIKKGETVIWKNESNRSMWTASARHPIHNGYPGSGVEMCGTNTLIAIFDACKGYDSGESWEFRFDNIGTWGYHNHVNSSHFGKIIVTE